MTQRQRNRGVRPAFTLIEILVVITIIAILVSLTAAAVMRGLVKGPELVDSTEIGELQAKLANVIKNPANPIAYLPSQLHLSKTNNYTANPKSPSYNPASPNFALDRDSMAFLQARFGKHTCFDFQCPPPQIIDWNGDLTNEELYLEGEQCLVFHLGGLPIYSPANTVPPANVTGTITFAGFSNNPQNPAQAPQNANERRQGPYFEFQSNRLESFSSAFPGNTGTYPIYLDPWTSPGGNANRKPYAFFASYNVEGGGLYNKYPLSDCLSLTAPTTGNPLAPYQASATTFLNPSSFQIISAGRPVGIPPVGNHSAFGAGGTLWGRTGTTDPLGKYNQSNFSAHLLGVAP
jgi:prepilin-type N-terminal cleavage/methylation domain-containing protein